MQYQKILKNSFISDLKRKLKSKNDDFFNVYVGKGPRISDDDILPSNEIEEPGKIKLFMKDSRNDWAFKNAEVLESFEQIFNSANI